MDIPTSSSPTNSSSSSTPATTNSTPQPSNLQTFPVVLFSKKAVNIAKFNTPGVDFSKWKKNGPIKMYRARVDDEPKVEEKKEGENKGEKGGEKAEKGEKTDKGEKGESKGESKVDNRPPFRKGMKIFPTKFRNLKNIPWRLENGGKTFEGKTEANPSQYALFILEGNQFKIVPVSDWVDFRPYKQITTLTTEQAEELMNQRNSKADDWARKMAGLNDKKADKEKEGGETKGPKKKTLEEEEEEEYRFEVSQSEDNEKFAAFGVVEEGNQKKNLQSKNKEIRAGDDDFEEDNFEDEENGDEPDFFGKFDDDEETNIALDDDTNDKDDYHHGFLDGIAPKAVAGEAEAEEEGDELDESGKEIKKLLKREEDDSDEDLYGSDDDDLDDDEDEININELSMFYPRNSNLSGFTKLEKDVKEEAKEEKGLSQASTTNDKSKGKKPAKKAIKKEDKDKKEDKKEEKKEEKKEDKEKKAKKPATKRAADSTTTPQNKKTKVDSKTPQTTPQAATTTSTTASTPTSTSTSNTTSTPTSTAPKTAATTPRQIKLAESEVVRILKQGKITIPELLSKFKPTLLTDEDKAKFKGWITKLAVAEDYPDGNKYLILKPEYK